MELVVNTRKLLSPKSKENESKLASTLIEFHFSSRRELYDSTILTADRYHSGAGEWVALRIGRSGKS